MPNWCEGTFRARGKLENIKRFILEGIEAAANDVCRIKEIEPESSDCKASFEVESYYGMLWLKDTKRQFIEPREKSILNIYDVPGKTGIGIFMEPFKGAWAINEEDMMTIAKDYQIEVKVNGYEMGGRFEQTVEVDAHGIFRERKYKYYVDYDWDCPMPLLGG